ncbi:hypothetical protein SAMN04488033_1234 [Salegentibacter agarivorans]|uniref:Uncharacterized protein n=1 Tax=Salegentibacter agarivorans TaxID=345907 RepID=A0A1I2NSU1_9FLAO|nr:hypothetical protein SAMN04488033_1234 [Salegentibacter agarivorans]
MFCVFMALVRVDNSRYSGFELFIFSITNCLLTDGTLCFLLRQLIIIHKY